MAVPKIARISPSPADGMAESKDTSIFLSSPFFSPRSPPASAMIIPPDKKEPVYDPANPFESSPLTQTGPSTLDPAPAAPPGDGHERTHVDRRQTNDSPTSTALGRTSRRAEEGQATEETALLPPPSYFEAVSQSAKPHAGRRWRRYLVVAVVGVIGIICLGVFLTIQRRRAQDANREWKRGGMDGKGEPFRRLRPCKD